MERPNLTGVREALAGKLHPVEVSKTLDETYRLWSSTRKMYRNANALNLPFRARSDAVNDANWSRNRLDHSLKSSTTTAIEEELYYRFLPSILTKTPIPEPVLVVASSTYFAWEHNSTSQGNASDRKIPAAQFMFGAYCWQLMRKRGILHSIIAHSEWNALCSLRRIQLEVERSKIGRRLFKK